MGISNRIQVLRKNMKMSQEELANEMNVSRQAVSKWETGQSNPDTNNIIAMAKIFDVSTDYIIMGTKDYRKEPNSKNIFIPSFILIVIGVVLSCCLPLIATLYQGYMLAKWKECLTNANEYIFRFPLLGLTLIAAICLIVGVGSAVVKYVQSKGSGYICR